MQVKILYFSGCPNWHRAADRTRTALAELGRSDIAVQGEDINQVPDLPQHWAGSPTVLVDGQDPFVADEGARETIADSLRRRCLLATDAGCTGQPRDSRGPRVSTSCGRR